MLVINDKYVMRKLNLSDLDGVMKFKCFDEVNTSIDFINEINQNDLLRNYEYYAVFKEEILLAIFSYNVSLSNTILIDGCSITYDDDFNQVIEHFKNVFYKQNIVKVDIKVNGLNDSLKNKVNKAGFNFNGEVFSNATKTLVFNGSPKNGISKAICSQLEERYADVEVINAYEYNVKACTDCGFCSKNVCECVYNDMNDIYSKIAESANIVIVSPVHVGSISAPLLAMFSRLQIYFANKFVFKNEFPYGRKQGFAIAVSGQDWDGQRNGMKVIFKHALLEMNANFNNFCYLSNTDEKKVFSSQLDYLYKEMDEYVRKQKPKSI